MTPSADELKANGDGPVHVRITLGHTGDQALDVRVSPESAPQMKALFEAEGIYSGEALEFSASQDLAILVASFGGGLTGLAAALTAFFHRNRHRHVKFSYGDDVIEVSGYNSDETLALVSTALDEMHARQLKQDEEWRRILKDDMSDGSR